MVWIHYNFGVAAIVHSLAGGRADAPEEGLCGPRRWREAPAGHSDEELFFVRGVQDLLSRGYLDFPGVPKACEWLVGQDVRARRWNPKWPFEVDGFAIVTDLLRRRLHGCMEASLRCSRRI